ncbi:MAG TPA: hypothetical protein VH092_02255 [Urbifossiella sp.]|jgi:hypothetical protein|nr:hypothetical protein [Urbifossiella sp.]
MKSALKVLLPLGLLLAVVFVVTIFARHTPDEVDSGTTGKSEAPTAKRLVFFTATRKWDPTPNANLQDRAFDGFYEPGETTQATHFWFENRNPGKVTLKVVRVSCSACSGCRVAPIPPDAVRGLLQMAAVSALPIGPVGGCPVGMAGAGAVLNSRLEWQAHAFKDGPSNATYNIPPPADTDGWSPGWGILELNFKVRPNPSVPLQAGFATVDEANQVVGTDGFSIYFQAAVGVELDKSAIDAGELADNTPAQKHVVTVYSSTRTADEIPDLAVRVDKPGGGEAGPFVTAGKLEPVPEEELDRLAYELSVKAGKPTRVRSAFRVPVTIASKVGDARPDIGRLDRELWVTARVPGMEPRKVSIKAAVTGPLALSGGATEINLGSFKYQDEASETVVVVCDKPGAVVELVPGASQPDYLQPTLRKLPDAGGRGQWQLTVRVPPGRVQGELADGLVILEMKGPAPQRIRVPVRGRGVL